MIPAAQYLRMSTEHQQYSFANQTAAIAQYATEFGFDIVMTYSDSGRTGVVLNRRLGLSRLLHDVIAGNTNFKTILVLDVSRWGRFQDDDEAACYEFLCRSSGVQVLYCTEGFANDGSISSTLMKNLQRASAAEFSRELGVEVFKRQAAVVKRGFCVGGPTPYGFRRIVTFANTGTIRVLERGEHKGASNDRVALVLGPNKEVLCVRQMFQMALAGKGPAQIAREINKSRGRKKWHKRAVRLILKSPIYKGCTIWNRFSQRLYGPHISNSPNDWVVNPNGCPAIVTPAMFEAVQLRLKQRIELRNWTKQKVLDRLRVLLSKKGRLTKKIIDSTPEMPSMSTIRKYAGSVTEAYELVGYVQPKVLALQQLGMNKAVSLRKQLKRELARLFPGQLVYENTRQIRCQFRLNGIALSAAIPRCAMRRGEPRWAFVPLKIERHKMTLVCLSTLDKAGLQGFYLFPRIDLRTFHWIKEDDPWLKKGIRLNSLAELKDIAISIQLRSN